MSRHTQQILSDYLTAGGCLIMGPELPQVDEQMQRCSTLNWHQSPRLHRINSTDELAELLPTLGVITPWSLDNPTIDFAIHECGGDRIVFLANPTSQMLRGNLRLPHAQALTPLLDGMPGPGGSQERFVIDLSPHAIQMLAVQPC